MEHVEWEEATIRIIEEKLEVTTFDAQGIVEAPIFILAQSWGRGLTPEAAAEKVIAGSRVPGEALPNLDAAVDICRIKGKCFTSAQIEKMISDFTGYWTDPEGRSDIEAEAANALNKNCLQIAKQLQVLLKEQEDLKAKT